MDDYWQRVELNMWKILAFVLIVMLSGCGGGGQTNITSMPNEGVNDCVSGGDMSAIPMMLIGSSTWNISLGSYSGLSCSFSGQSSAPEGLAMNPSNGTDLFMLGGSTVYQYALSSAWYIATAAYAGKTMSIATQDAAPVAIILSPDGTKLYAVGYNNKRIYQYTLSTPFDVSTASYSGKSLLVSGLFIHPTGIVFSDDGTKVYIPDSTSGSQKVYQYTLSTAWDISTGVYASKSMAINSQVVTPANISFKPDGKTVYIMDSNTSKIYQYTLSTAWDISTGSYSGLSLTISSQDNQQYGLVISPSGNVVFTTGFQHAQGYQYKIP